MSYVQKLDDTFWVGYDPGGGQDFPAWSGTEWDAPTLNATIFGDLNVVGSWAVGYRPANLRITLSVTGGTNDLRVQVFNAGDGDFLNIGHTIPTPITVTSTPTAFIIPLDFTPISADNLDIATIDIVQDTLLSPWGLTIHNIEFDTGSAPEFWQNYVKTTETDA
jgi:hypothetical protein